jgi:hypothetical protein
VDNVDTAATIGLPEEHSWATLMPLTSTALASADSRVINFCFTTAARVPGAPLAALNVAAAVFVRVNLRANATKVRAAVGAFDGDVAGPAMSVNGVVM